MGTGRSEDDPELMQPRQVVPPVTAAVSAAWARTGGAAVMVVVQGVGPRTVPLGADRALPMLADAGLNAARTGALIGEVFDFDHFASPSVPNFLASQRTRARPSDRACRKAVGSP